MCKDISVKALNELGYNVVREPRVGIDPFSFLTRDHKNMTLLGSIEDVILNPKPLPNVKKDQPAASISGTKTNKIDFNAGLNFLSKVLKFLGAGSLGIDAAYKNAHKIEFEYLDVHFDSVTANELAKYIRNAEPDLNHPFFDNFDQENESFVIIETLKSSSFATIAFDEHGTKIGIDVDAIKAIVGANVKVETGAEGTTKVSFKGETPLVFGYKACPVWAVVDAGKAEFRVKPQKPNVGPLAMIPVDLAHSETLTPVLIGGEGTLLKVKDPK